MSRRHNFQTLSWFYDLQARNLLDLDPPYQRRSVWNQNFKDYFVDTVLLNYPAPALFLYEDITPDGRSVYHLVDGKQRLTTLFEFVGGAFPVSDKSEVSAARGKYFASLDDPLKKSFWSYQFLVEYVPADDEKLINGIFDRINRNVAKLTAQELRHAKLDGEFISAAEALTEWMDEMLPKKFPRFAEQSKKQMKDVEFVALLLLLLESGPRGYSQDDLDQAFTDRDESWESRLDVDTRFRSALSALKVILESSPAGRDLVGSRLRNQADFYSLIGAIDSLLSLGRLPEASQVAERLNRFVRDVDDEVKRREDAELATYFDAARSASNDKGPREARIAIVTKRLIGNAS